MIKNIIFNKEHRVNRCAVVEDGKLAEVFIESDKQIVGSIYKCSVENIISGIDAAFVNIGEEKNAFLYAGDIITEEDFEESRHRHKKQKNQSIGKMLKEGQEILVQVVKAPRGTKGARVTTKITLPGRYLVLIPGSDTIGISQRIGDEERKRLKKLIEEIKPKNYGIIVRTEGEGISKKDLDHDIKLMIKIYENILNIAKDRHTPSLIYKDLSLLYKVIRDHLSNDTNALYIDSQEDYKKALSITEFFDPRLKNKLKLYKEKAPIFEYFGIEHQFKQIFKRKVWLPSGGNICIDHAEAMTVIDVNSAKFTGKKNVDDTVLITNLEAAKEIARQIRLRDIGGIIIVDFIDMQNGAHKKQLITKLGQELKKEKTRTNISQVTQLGLVEMTRKRVYDAVSETVTEMCPYCEGRGRIESAETVSLRAEREIRNYLAENKNELGIIVNLHPSAAIYLIGEKGKNISLLENFYETKIYVRAYSDMHAEDIKILKVTPQMTEALNPISIGQVYTVRPENHPITFKDLAYTWISNIYVEIPYGAKFAGKQKKIYIKEFSRNYGKSKIKED